MKKLYEEARSVLKNSYSKYSDFKVAAAIRMKDGKIITGVNVENASYGLANCAERSALFTAYGMGYHKEDIEEMLITTAQDARISPCGACRQVMNELMPKEAKIYIVNTLEDSVTILNKELLPLAFDEDDL